MVMLMFSPQQFGSIPLTVADSTLGTSSPSVVAETPLYYSLGIKDNQLLRYGEYWFAFYFNGSSLAGNDGAILCRTSLDGETWSQPTIAVNDANMSAYFSVYQSNESVVIAYSSMPLGDPYYNCIVRTKRGTISSNNITWGTSVVVLSGANIGWTIGNFWGDYAFGKHWLAVEYLVDGLYYCCNIYCTEDFLNWQFSKHWDTWAGGDCAFQVWIKFVQNSRLMAFYGGRYSYEFNYMFFDGSTWSSESSTVGSGLPWGSYKAHCEAVVNGTLYMLYSVWDSKTSLKLAVYDGSWSFNDFLVGDRYWGGDSSAVFDMKTNVLYFFYVNADNNQIEAAYSTNYVDWYKSVKICESVFGSPRHTRSMRYCEGEPALLWMEGTSQPYKIRFAKALLKIVPNIFPTIQEAINNASDGDTILVLNGTYYENVVVNKSVSIVGESRGTAIIDGNNNTRPVMLVKADNTSISRVCLRNASGGGQGILVQDSLNVAITRNLVFSTTFGIIVQGCSNTTVSDNNLTNNYGHGLELDWSNNVDVLNNSVSENLNEGIYVYDCQNCSIEGNTVSGNHWSGVLIQSGSGNLLDHNTVTNNGPIGGIWLFDGTMNNVITDNILSNNSRGIYIGFWTDFYPSPHGNFVVGNTVTSNDIGIDVDYGVGNVIYHNKVVGNLLQSRAKLGYDNTWDDGYPSGGNCWSDYNGTDLFSGPYQNETDSDGIGDTQYYIEENNTDFYPFMNVDIAVTNLTISKTRVAQGYCAVINVTFEEHGDYIYPFNLTILANSTLVYSKHIMPTEVNSTLVFSWNTTGFAYGNYTIGANAESLLAELDTTNNNLNCSVPVHIGVRGDCSGPTAGVPDGICSMRDIQFVIARFNAKPGDPWRWAPYADINEDGVMNMRDIQIQIINFGRHE